ncbi:transmembrane anterior posterior transformation protein 1 homolog isoform X2 [Dreissena polymorpha]|nr:transmembrane anterior posterior transformation protein 1 homolog isoform X2 [Dreissena polymorpha]XP_052226015.1 transmembrane anterior posterior transformation protein 1 homolog isoform X2 [Dreissena polymorpha]XP_052226016.1 transmembrane anterior posterior transformation protein 1 homolog isoform X2 [Dreissena polymorpha]XP_052226017.1 transmembrane anterior posterior transformation protein 1 homolog isoform X2 [Dreissena polymorpha]
MSVFSYFTTELTRGYLLEREEEKYAQKRQRVYTFMKTPRELEKLSIYGFFLCLDAFLFIFTFLPLRICLAVLKVFTLPCGLMRSRHYLEPSQICDILKGVLLVVCSFLLSYVDTSMMYHLVRGQATIKLYVFFNMLDMADRLLSSFGHDILDALFWTATEPRGRKRDHLGTLTHLLIAVIYVFFHALLILFQATVLNVAFNSHNKALLVIMMSNNLAEIKSNLFKRVDKNNLYQISCSDVKERFHYVVLLFVVCIRNMNEVAWDMEHLWVLLPDAIIVLISEILVDWGKHAFILKFNEILADVYWEFRVRLAMDMATSRQSQAFSDPADLVSRRMGLTPLPLACLLYRILSRSVRLNTVMDYAIVLMICLCLMSFKVLNSIILLGHSYKVIQKYHQQNTEEKESTNPETAANKTTNENPTEMAETINHNKESNFSDERRASSDTSVPKNFSQIFSANSYTELTMVQDHTPIEPKEGFVIKMPRATTPDDSQSSFSASSSMSLNSRLSFDHSKESCDQNESCDQTLSNYVDRKLEIHNSTHGDNLNNVTQNSASASGANTFSDNRTEINSDSDNNINKINSDSEQCSEIKVESKPLNNPSMEGATLFQRSKGHFLMSFSMGRKIGSSTSLPESIGTSDGTTVEGRSAADDQDPEVSKKHN